MAWTRIKFLDLFILLSTHSIFSYLIIIILFTKVALFTKFAYKWPINWVNLQIFCLISMKMSWLPTNIQSIQHIIVAHQVTPQLKLQIQWVKIHYVLACLLTQKSPQCHISSNTISIMVIDLWLLRANLKNLYVDVSTKKKVARGVYRLLIANGV